MTGLSLFFVLSCMHACMPPHTFPLGLGLGGPPSSTQPPPQLPWVERPAPAGPVAKVEFEDGPPSFFFLFASSHRCLGRASSCTPCAGESEHSAMSLFRFVKLSWGRALNTCRHNALGWVDCHVGFGLRVPPYDIGLEHLTLHRNISECWMGLRACIWHEGT